MPRKRREVSLEGVYIAAESATGPDDQNAILIVGRPSRDLPRLLSPKTKTRPIAPGIDAEWSGKSLAGVRVYPKPPRGEPGDYRPIRASEVKQLKRLAGWLAKAVEGFERALQGVCN